MRVLPFLNNHKNLDPSYKMDLDFGIIWEGKSPYTRTNTIPGEVSDLEILSSYVWGLELWAGMGAGGTTLLFKETICS